MGALSFGKNTFELEEFKFCLWVNHSTPMWDFEIYTPDESNYIMLNATTLPGVNSPLQLSGKSFEIRDELLENTVYVNGRERFMKSLSISFGEFQRATNTIAVQASGKIHEEENPTDPEVNFKIEGKATFTFFSAIGPGESESLDSLLSVIPFEQDDLQITYQKAADGINCIAFLR